MKKKNRKFNPGPITVMLIITFIIMVFSFVLNKIGIRGKMTDPNTFETTTVTVNNIFTKEGIRYIAGTSLKNFREVEPLVAIIVSLITISILEVSGLLGHIFGIFKNLKSYFVTFIVFFVSVISSLVGDYSYAILLPLVISMYKTLNRDPKSGVLTVFVGVTMGYGTGLIYNYQDVQLGAYTQTTARNVLDNYIFTGHSMLFIMIASTLILSIVGTIMSEKYFTKKLRRKTEDEMNYSRKGLISAGIVFLVMMAITIWSIIPGLPFSGWMLSSSKGAYIERLVSSSAPFKDGIMLIILCIALACSYIYGKTSRNIKDNREFNKAISKTFQNTGFIFAGLFFASLMISVLDWTNISTVISLNLIELVGSTQMSGVFIIFLTFVVSILITILNPNSVYNWKLASPVLVSNLARANISPEFTQMIFKAGDSIGKCLSPFYLFFIITLGFLYKADSEDEDINFFNTIRKMLPVVVVLILTWLVIIVGWNLIGIPLGLNGTTNM